MQTMTNEDKKFITDLFSTFEKSINGQFISLKEIFNIKFDEVKNNQKKFREDFLDIFRRLGIIESKVNVNETVMENHLQSHKEGNTNKRSWIGIIMGILGSIIVGLVLYILIGG